PPSAAPTEPTYPPADYQAVPDHVAPPPRAYRPAATAPTTPPDTSTPRARAPTPRPAQTKTPAPRPPAGPSRERPDAGAGGWLRRLLHGEHGDGSAPPSAPADADASTPDQPGSEATQAAQPTQADAPTPARDATGPPLSERAQALAAQLRELEPDELAALAANDTPFGRAVQAETDRREARR